MVIQELRNCLSTCDLPESGPVRACSTCFVAHKVAALGRVIDKYCVYLSHLVTISEDKSFKSADREKLNGRGMLDNGLIVEL